MKRATLCFIAASIAALTGGMAIGLAANVSGIALARDRSMRDAGLAMLVEMERLSCKDPSDAIPVARIYYLAGEKAKGDALIDRALRKRNPDDLQVLGELYAEMGDADRADEFFKQAVAASPKDDWGQIEMGAWYIRLGRREEGEALFAKALARSPERAKHFLRAGEAYLGVTPSR